MDVYVVESYELVLRHRGGQSRGVQAEGYTGIRPLYLHLLPLGNEDLQSLAEPDPTFRRRGSREGTWWIVEGEGAQAHWPGLPMLRASWISGRPTSLRESLGGTPAAGRQAGTAGTGGTARAPARPPSARPSQARSAGKAANPPAAKAKAKGKGKATAGTSTSARRSGAGSASPGRASGSPTASRSAGRRAKAGATPPASPSAATSAAGAAEGGAVTGGLTGEASSAPSGARPR